ncbi:release factor glutamine methyltransferase [Antricoccus suffuscus]|uniref:Release factor glutamine methyltransferase n=1 Tax=Antricoccus suffuscus TaxID=1629062 RepID=A0A2T1A455_9ACTN|nr:peptide chain release factor N(5)-glutamine methyltransferase [Antricoccus suffuscus]PRZ43386.1 release factor glutamine methyltransferase [Antricoccus suffuscus]
MIEPGSPHHARIQGARRLATAGVASAAYDAAELLAQVLHTEALRLPMAADLDAEQAAAYEALLVRREAREPLQHILGVAYFDGLEIAVGPGVFTPRPETELIVEYAAKRLSAVDRPRVVDMCAGSGAIALALKNRLPAAYVAMVEIDPVAASWARRNAKELGLDVTVRCDDATDLAAVRALGPVDVVTCNPPYVPIGVPVAAEVRDHDPALALWGGADGLDVIRRLLPVIAALLVPGGLVLIEHHDDHQPELLALIETVPGFSSVRGHRDLAGRPRFASAVWAPRAH